MRPLGWAFALYGVTTLLSQAAMSIGAAVLAVALLAGARGPAGLWASVRAELRAPESRKFAWITAVLIATCALSLVTAALYPLTYGGHGPELTPGHDVLKFWYLFWPFFIVIALRKLRAYERERAIQIWLWAFGLLSAFGIAQYYWGWPRYQSIPETSRFHAVLFLGHHLSVASIFIFPFFIALDLAYRRGARAIALWIAVALGAAVLFFTYSRMLWIALPIGILVWIFMNLPRRYGVGLAVALVLALAGLSQTEMAARRIHNLGGLDERRDLWLANIDFMLARPLTGAGLHHTQELSGYYLVEKTGAASVFSGHAHNNLIEMLGGTGIPGALAWLAWSGFVLLTAWRCSRGRLGRSFARGIFCAWVVFQLNGLTQVNFWEGKVEHSMMLSVGWLLFLASEKRSARRGLV